MSWNTFFPHLNNQVRKESASSLSKNDKVIDDKHWRPVLPHSLLQDVPLWFLKLTSAFALVLSHYKFRPNIFLTDKKNQVRDKGDEGSPIERSGNSTSTRVLCWCRLAWQSVRREHWSRKVIHFLRFCDRTLTICFLSYFIRADINYIINSIMLVLEL